MLVVHASGGAWSSLIAVMRMVTHSQVRQNLESGEG
jgi:hypothetical protein